MLQKTLRIRQGAVFIADSHHHSFYCNTLNSIFQNLLQSPSCQIFLMGDIFDFLVGNVQKTLEDNQETLKLLEKLSKKHEIYYFEGNHDFLLSKISYFKNICCFPFDAQPVCFEFGNKKAYLAHGDIFLSQYYKFYTKIIRQPFVVRFLDFFSIFLYSKILHYLQNKKKFQNLNLNSNKFSQNNDKLAILRIEKYQKKMTIPVDSYIIEGHFHWGKSVKFNKVNYIGLPFFACKKRYFVVEYTNDCLSLSEKEF